jgi:hypothetical protein
VGMILPRAPESMISLAWKVGYLAVMDKRVCPYIIYLLDDERASCLQPHHSTSPSFLGSLHQLLYICLPICKGPFHKESFPAFKAGNASSLWTGSLTPTTTRSTSGSLAMASALLYALFAGKPHCLAAAAALAGDEVARAVTVYPAERLARREPM